MRNALIVTFAFLFVAVAGFAQTPSNAPLSGEILAAILGQPATEGSCPTPQSGMFLSKSEIPPPQITATCTASCGGALSVSCTGSTCSAFNRNCPSEQGHVVCDGVATWCPTTCSCAFNDWCCLCQETAECFYCCRCDGGSSAYCRSICNG